MNVIQPLIDGFLHHPVPFLIPIFVVLGMLALVSGFTLRGQGKVINWAKTTGTLVDCSVVSQKIKSRVSNMTINEAHLLTISYLYKVNGKQYEGNKFKADGGSILITSRNEGEKIAQKFKASPTLTVYYDPNNPSDCTLKIGQRQTGTSATVNFGAGVGLLILAAGMFLVFRPY